MIKKFHLRQTSRKLQARITKMADQMRHCKGIEMDASKAAS
jgi:hypothetical protein